MVYGNQQLNYDDRLNYLGLMRLEKRRVRDDVNETFTFMNAMMLRKIFLNWITEVEEDMTYTGELVAGP